MVNPHDITLLPIFEFLVLQKKMYLHLPIIINEVYGW